MKATTNDNSWLLALQEQMSSNSDKPTADWKTSKKIGEEINRSETSVLRLIRSMDKAGKVEKKIFRIVSGGIIRPVPHYRLKKH